MAPIRAPAQGRRLVARQHQPQPASPCDVPYPVEQRAAGGRLNPIVTEDDTAPARQSLHGAEQACVVHPLVGHQPERGEGMQSAHRPPIAAPMSTDSPTLDSAAARLADITGRIAGAARVAGRRAEDVTLIAISKTHDADAITPLIAAGCRVFGENRVQEAEGKWPALKERHPGLSLHMVGQLQSNKAEEAVALFDAIHGVDRPSLVAALAKAMDKTGRRPDCFVQVNIGDEAQKGGCAVADLPALLAEARAADLPVAGLMCVPPADVEAAPFFALLAKLAREYGLAGLSMGMSQDFETAVMLGATHVRVGTALFGGRS